MKLEDLPQELQEKARACDSLEDFLAIAKEEGFEFTDEELENIAGGIGPALIAEERIVPPLQ